MARSKTPAAQLADLLDAAPIPVYVLDDQRRIVFVNRCLVRWLGVAAQELVGRRVDYHSGDAGGPPGAAAGLCPAPEAFAGRESTGHVSSMSVDGRLLHRRARFVPLGVAADGGDAADCVGVVTLLAPADLEDAPLPTVGGGEPTADELHLRIRQFRQEESQRFALDGLVGNSPAACRARAQVALAAEGLASVLIVGPPGSGRLHVARAIHYRSEATREGRLVLLDCPLLASDQMRQSVESLVAGPGTGAATFLLQDVDQLSPDLQWQLSEWVSRAGPRVRFIATAREALSHPEQAGPYRRELAYRLSTMVMELPPLVERMEDLSVLAQLFLEEANRDGQRQVGGISAEAMDLLALYHWPRNLDELVEVMHAAHRSAESHEVRPADLPPRFRHAADATIHPRREDEPIVLEDFIKGIERKLIKRALQRAKGNKAKAARLLGMTRPRFYRRLVQLGMAERPGSDT